MIELIIACFSAAGPTCPIGVPPNAGVQWNVPIKVCLENNSDQFGRYTIVEMTESKAVIRVSPNVHLCDDGKPTS